MKDFSPKQMKECFTLAKVVGETLKQEGHAPVSAFVVAAILVHGVAKPGALEPVLEHFNEVLRELELDSYIRQ